MFKMKLTVFYAIFLGCLSFQQISASCSSSDISKINSCYNDYMTKLGISRYSTFNDYYNYVKNYYILISWDYVNNFCNIFGKLQYCVNKDCINNNDFKKVATFGGNSASDFVGNYYGFDYMCGEGKLRYQNSYNCLKNYSQIFGNDCSNFGDDCTSRKNENICFANDANKYCGSEARIYVNTSMSTTLCHSNPECCSNSSSRYTELTMGYIFLLFIIGLMSTFFN